MILLRWCTKAGEFVEKWMQVTGFCREERGWLFLGTQDLFGMVKNPRNNTKGNCTFFFWIIGCVCTHLHMTQSWFFTVGSRDWTKVVRFSQQSLLLTEPSCPCLLPFLMFIYVCLCVCYHFMHEVRGQLSGSWFSSSTMWISAIKLKLWGFYLVGPGCPFFFFFGQGFSK